MGKSKFYAVRRGREGRASQYHSRQQIKTRVSADVYELRSQFTKAGVKPSQKYTGFLELSINPLRAEKKQSDGSTCS